MDSEFRPYLRNYKNQGVNQCLPFINVSSFYYSIRDYRLSNVYQPMSILSLNLPITQADTDLR